MVLQKAISAKITESRKEILEVLQKKNGSSINEIAQKTNRTRNITYHKIKQMERLRFVRTEKIGKEVYVFLVGNSEEEKKETFFLKIIDSFGLTDTDVKVLRAKGEDTNDIAKQIGMLANMVEQRKNNIFIRLDVATLKQARQKIKLLSKNPGL